jgi:hypothetical protein
VAVVKADPQTRWHHLTDRPFTGSVLFPELVWTHWAWQSRIRPHVFPRPGRARRILSSAARLNGRPSRSRKNGEADLSEIDLPTLEREYEELLASFQNSEGEIVRAYWCTTEASAVVLTEKTKRLSWLPWRRLGNLRLHRETEWVTADAPVIADLLHNGDTLAIRINRVLTQEPRRIAMEWVFSEQSYLLGFVERMGGRPSRKDTASTVARHQLEVDRIERYYDRAANKAARIRYFVGMLVGLLFVAALGALVAGVIELFATLDLTDDSTRKFYACFGAGAVGAMVSVMTRMRQADGVTLDYEVGAGLIVMLGAFRPVLGAIFGVLAYFALASGFLGVTPPSPGTAFFFYAVFAFAAGFSERFAHVILGSADLTVAKGLAGAEIAEPEEASASAQGTPTPAPAAHNGHGAIDSGPAAVGTVPSGRAAASTRAPGRP